MGYFSKIFATVALLQFQVLIAFASPEPPFELPQASELRKIRSAIMYTEKGNVYFELYPDEAPWHVANFKFLADRGFFKNMRFHAHVPDRLIQAGRPKLSEVKGYNYVLPAEFNPHLNEAGALGMARKPDRLNPDRNSLGTEFHILVSDAPRLDGAYTVFGKVIRGMKVVENLEKGDVIKNIVVFIRPSGSARR